MHWDRMLSTTSFQEEVCHCDVPESLGVMRASCLLWCSAHCGPFQIPLCQVWPFKFKFFLRLLSKYLFHVYHCCPPYLRQLHQWSNSRIPYPYSCVTQHPHRGTMSDYAVARPNFRIATYYCIDLLFHEPVALVQYLCKLCYAIHLQSFCWFKNNARRFPFGI